MWHKLVVGWGIDNDDAATKEFPQETSWQLRPMPRAAEVTLTGRQVVLLKVIDRGVQLSLAIVKALTVLGLGYLAKEAVLGLAGHNTSILRSFLTSTGSGGTAVAGVGVGGLGAGYGVWQRRLHRRSIRHFGPRLAKYESMLDPNRTSSGLTEFGQTNPDQE